MCFSVRTSDAPQYRALIGDGWSVDQLRMLIDSVSLESLHAPLCVKGSR